MSNVEMAGNAFRRRQLKQPQHLHSRRSRYIGHTEADSHRPLREGLPRQANHRFHLRGRRRSVAVRDAHRLAKGAVSHGRTVVVIRTGGHSLAVPGLRIHRAAVHGDHRCHTVKHLVDRPFIDIGWTCQDVDESGCHH